VLFVDDDIKFSKDLGVLDNKVVGFALMLLVGSDDVNEQFLFAVSSVRVVLFSILVISKKLVAQLTVRHCRP
jgi:hypothetical protein